MRLASDDDNIYRAGEDPIWLVFPKLRESRVGGTEVIAISGKTGRVLWCGSMGE